jgi:hypothetical protein
MEVTINGKGISWLFGTCVMVTASFAADAAAAAAK